MKILIFDADIKISNISDVSNIINLVLNEKLFIQNLSNNNNWTGESINKILYTIRKYIDEFELYNVS